MRTAGIWATGLLGSAILGAMIGNALAKYDDGGFFGFIAGPLFFTCARLWLAERTTRPQKDTVPVFDLKDGHLR